VDEPVTPAEAEALTRVRELLPDDPLCHAWANLTFPDQTGHLNEVDLLLLIRQGFFVVELKGWHGKVVGRLNDWQLKHPGGGSDQRANPLNLTDRKAKRLKGLLQHEANESREQVRLPYIAPAVVMHGRGSQIELSSATRGSVFGLDGFAVRGVPSFTELFKAPSRNRQLDKVETDALVRLVRNSGLAPRLAHADTSSRSTPSVESPVTRVPASAPPAAGVAGSPLEDLTDDQLHRLGVAADSVTVVRRAKDIESLIGRLPDDVWDDLEAVAGGEPVEDVVERRQAATTRFAEVSARAIEVGWAPAQAGSSAEAEHEVAAPPSEASHEDPVSDLERRLRETFGDAVRSRGASRTAAAAAAQKIGTPQTSGNGGHPAATPLIPAETLLTVARTEAMAGPLEAAHQLMSGSCSAWRPTTRWTGR
jgi:hypothetical protein